MFRKEWKDAISGLPDEVRLEIYEAIIEYGTTGKSSDLKPMAMLAFSFAKATLDRDAERYEEMKKKRSAAGKKGGAPAGNSNASKNKQNKQNKQNQAKQAKQADSVSVYGSSYEDYKKPPEGGKKDAATAAALLEGRKEDFYNSLIPFVAKYGKEMVRDFFDYWTEPNKSNSKMRFELQRTWDLARRLGTWARRDNQFNQKSNGTDNQRSNSAEQTVVAAADAIKELLADNE